MEKNKNNYLLDQFSDYIDTSLLLEITEEILKDERFKDVLKSGSYQFFQTNDGVASNADYDIYLNVSIISWYCNKCKKRMSNEENKGHIKKVLDCFFCPVKVSELFRKRGTSNEIYSYSYILQHVLFVQFVNF